MILVPAWMDFSISAQIMPASVAGSFHLMCTGNPLIS
jgi:hypothetical protein